MNTSSSFSEIYPFLARYRLTQLENTHTCACTHICIDRHSLSECFLLYEFSIFTKHREFVTKRVFDRGISNPSLEIKNGYTPSILGIDVRGIGICDDNYGHQFRDLQQLEFTGFIFK
mgnify:CR=1 FL=1